MLQEKAEKFRSRLGCILEDKAYSDLSWSLKHIHDTACMVLEVAKCYAPCPERR